MHMKYVIYVKAATVKSEMTGNSIPISVVAHRSPKLLRDRTYRLLTM